MNPRDFERNIGNKMIPHKEQGASCPSIMGWPGDDLSKWVASHRNESKGIICRSSQGKNTRFCGTTGSHVSATRAKSTTGKSEEVPMGGSKARVETKKNSRAKATRKVV
jgi:hypothetical protein